MEQKNKIDDGGPAFPTGETLDANGDIFDYMVRGMSLRAWLAGQAMAGYRANPHDNLIGADQEKVAEWSVADADAIIAALKQTTLTQES